MTLPDVLRSPLALPVMASPMFIASGPELVIAECAAGVIGSFPALNARPASQLDEWLTQIDETLRKLRADSHADSSGSTGPVAPYAVNLIVHKSNERLDHDVEACIAHQVPIVVTSLGAREDVNAAIHAYGGIVLHDVINDRFAHKAVEKGADGLIAVAAGAGGHAGTQSPFALVREIRTWFDGPLLLSGAIAHGSSVLAALAAGADLAYVGSAFLSTHEANVDEAYKDMIVASGASDIVYSSHFSGVLANFLRGSIEAVGLDPDNLPGADPSKMDFAEGETIEAGGRTWKVWKDVWGSGQGIGTIDQRGSVQDLVTRLTREYDDALARLRARTES